MTKQSANRNIAGIALLSLALLASAQKTTPHLGEQNNGLGWWASDDHHVLYWAGSVSGPGLTKSNQYVSGNKAEFTVNIGMYPYWVDGTTDPDWHVDTSTTPYQWGTNFKVEIMDPGTGMMPTWQTIKTDPGPFYGTAQSPSPTTTFRVATTAYQHLETFRIRVSWTANYKYTTTGGGHGTTSSQYSHEFPFIAYNSMQLAGTIVEDVGTGGGNWHAYSALIENPSTQLISKAGGLGTSLNHLLSPSATAAMTQAKTDITGKITNATAAILNLHGYPDLPSGTDRVAASQGWNQAAWTGATYPSYSVTNTEIASQVSAKSAAGIPAYNNVFVYSCQTINATRPYPTSRIASGYGIGISSVAASYQGYSQAINVSCWTKADWDASDLAGKPNPYFLTPSHTRNAWIYDHFETYKQSVLLGKNVKQAALDADAAYPMISYTGTDTNTGNALYNRTATTLIGDPYTRLRYVYLTDAERATLAGQGVTNTGFFWVRLPVGQ